MYASPSTHKRTTSARRWASSIALPHPLAKLRLVEPDRPSWRSNGPSRFPEGRPCERLGGCRFSGSAIGKTRRVEIVRLCLDGRADNEERAACAEAIAKRHDLEGRRGVRDQTSARARASPLEITLSPHAHLGGSPRPARPLQRVTSSVPRLA